MVGVELVAAIASILGISARDLAARIAEIRKERFEQKMAIRREQENRYATQGNITTVLTRYYESTKSPNQDASLSRYCVVVDGVSIDTTIFTSDRNLSIREDPRNMFTSLTVQNLPSNTPERAVIDYAPKAVARLQSLGIKFWNQPLYRLLEIHGDENAFRSLFSVSDFFSYRFTSGLLADELIDALVDTEGSPDQICNDFPTYLPIRATTIPSLSNISDYRNRVCAGGVGVLLAMARSEPYNDFLIPLQVRSSEVSDGRGQLAVLPKAFHQPIIGDEEEVGLFPTVLRELYEEVYGHEEVERQSGKMRHDWYIDDEPGVAYLRDHIGAYVLEVLGIGINVVAGNYDFGILLAIRDTWYWNRYKNKLDKNWEAQNIIKVSSRDETKIKELLTSYSWANESVPPFVEGLLRLKELEPEKVQLPNIQRLMM